MQAADLTGDLNAVHIRQTPVDDVGVVDIAHLDGLPRAQHRLLAGKGPLGAHPHAGQQLGHAVAGIEIVVDDERLESGELLDPFLAAAAGLQAQRQADDELGAAALLGLHLDRAAHHVDDIPGDGHAEAGALNAADRRGALALERLEDALRERRAHADAGVADAELILRAAVQRPGELTDADRDRAARRGELDRVGQQVEQDLLEARPVAADVLVRHVERVHAQLELLGVHLSADDGLDVVQHLGQADLALLEMEPAALDAAHVQDVVDEREQMAARGEGLGQIVLHPFGVVDIGDREGGEADDGVHRGADIVAHVEQELPLGAVGRALVLERDLQFAVLLFQLGLILLLLLFFLLLHLLHRASAQHLQDRNEQDVTDQCR